MTAFFTDFAERNARTGRPSPTPLEIQRWEDDGGAVLPDAMPPRQRPRLHRTTDVRIRELVAAD
jgi:hypothetical protein